MFALRCHLAETRDRSASRFIHHADRNSDFTHLIVDSEQIVRTFDHRLLSADEADAFRSARPLAAAATLRLPAPVTDQRVDIVAIHPGCDATHIDASLQAGAKGIVLAALGSGNANPRIAEAVKRCAERGVPVIVSSRVPEGQLVATYGGGGGGHDLVAAGAVHSSTLRPGQARILLATLLAGKSPAETIVSAFGDNS